MKIRSLIIALGESVRFAFQSVRTNLLRTLLSLSGITIGVFCIIGIFTFVDSIELTVKGSLSRFGNNIILVQKWPWEFGADYPWWKYESRPELKYTNFQILQKRFTEAEAMSFNLFLGNNQLKARDNTLEEVSLRAVTAQYNQVVEMKFAYGRFFNENEAMQGAPVIVLGHELAIGLFGSPEQALGREVTALGKKLKVIGVLAKEGKALGIGGEQDRQGTIPLDLVRNQIDWDNPGFSPSIFVKGNKDIPQAQFEDDLRGAMRAIRKLSPKQEDDFALNKITLFANFLSSFFGQINFYGWIIAGFSILVGGFGIANIMFVSVKERTAIIGTQKALGAKSYVILVQFLAEAIFLCILGGAVGLLLIYGVIQLIAIAKPDLQLVLTLENIMLGIGISSIIGVLSGFFPAYQAGRMDPIDAIRTGI